MRRITPIVAIGIAALIVVVAMCIHFDILNLK